MPLCYYLTTQGTGLLLQLKERSRVVLGGDVLVAVGGWHQPALSVNKMRPAAITYDQHWSVIRQQQRDGSVLVRQRGQVASRTPRTLPTTRPAANL